jgi:hypothetical protein
MKIYINDHRKIFGIQSSFSALFPNLRIDFFGKAPHAKSSASNHLVSGSHTIGQCRTIHNKGVFTLTPTLTAGEVMGHLSDIFGISVRILRKEGSNWKEISSSDKHSLAVQNSLEELVLS